MDFETYIDNSKVSDKDWELLKEALSVFLKEKEEFKTDEKGQYEMPFAEGGIAGLSIFPRPGGEGGLAEISKALGPLNQATRTLPMHLAAIMQRMRFNSDRGPADEPIMQDPVGPPNDIFPDPSPVPPGMQSPFPFPFPTRPPGMPPLEMIGRVPTRPPGMPPSPFVELGMPYQNPDEFPDLRTPGDLLRGMPAPIGGLPSIFNSRQQSEFM